MVTKRTFPRETTAPSRPPSEEGQRYLAHTRRMATIENFLSTLTMQRSRCFFSFFRFAFFIFPDFSAISHFSCPRFHFAFSCPRFHFAFSCPRFHFAFFFLIPDAGDRPSSRDEVKCRVSSLVVGCVGAGRGARASRWAASERAETRGSSRALSEAPRWVS